MLVWSSKLLEILLVWSSSKHKLVDSGLVLKLTEFCGVCWHGRFHFIITLLLESVGDLKKTSTSWNINHNAGTNRSVLGSFSLMLIFYEMFLAAPELLICSGRYVQSDSLIKCLKLQLLICILEVFGMSSTRSTHVLLSVFYSPEPSSDRIINSWAGSYHEGLAHFLQEVT